MLGCAPTTGRRPWLPIGLEPEVRVHLEAENAYTETVMANTADLQTQLFRI